MRDREKQDRLLEVQTYLAWFTPDLYLSKLLFVAVGRPLMKRNAGGYINLSSLDRSAVQHVLDWLFAAVQRDEPWLKNTDQHGRPKKLLKFSNLEEAVREADDAFRVYIQQTGLVELEDGSESLYQEVDNEFRIVRLHTPEALDNESAKMQHCIGQGFYDNYLADSRYAFLSLRDRLNQPHATAFVDLEARKLIELQGKQNRKPVDRYVAPMLELVISEGLEFDNLVEYFGIVRDSSGTMYDVSDLPDELQVNGHLKLGGFKKPIRLPLTLRISGNYEPPAHATRHPETLEIGGELLISPDSGFEFPSSGYFRVGSLSLSKYTLGERTIPSVIDADTLMIDFHGIARRQVPKEMHVTGGLEILIDKLGKNFPENISAGNGLRISVDREIILPSRISCSGLVVTGSAETIGFGADVVVRGDFHTEQIITQWPPKLLLNGGMKIYRCQSKHQIFPDNLRIGGDMDVQAEKVTLGKNTSVGGDLVIEACFVKNENGIGNVKRIGGGLNIAFSNVRAVPDHLRKFKYLTAVGSELEELPDGLTVKENLCLNGSRVSRLPNALWVGRKLFAQNTDIEELPEDAHVGDQVYGIANAKRAERPVKDRDRVRSLRSLAR